MTKYPHLQNDCNSNGYCNACAEPVKQDTLGNWFITASHPGFNSPANNRSGYKTKDKAVASYKKYRAK